MSAKFRKRNVFTQLLDRGHIHFAYISVQMHVIESTCIYGRRQNSKDVVSNLPLKLATSSN